MILETNFFVSQCMLNETLSLINEPNFRTSINKPTGKFFYDPWIIKEEFKETVWDKILSTLPFNIGEARIIILQPGTCYQIHADIDDRYHLNITGEECYMINIQNNHLHKLTSGGQWFEMDASSLHSAANFGRYPRVQLVVRKLLNDNKLKDPAIVKITTDTLSEDDRRFVFDQTLSTWLNLANKKSLISDFEFTKDVVQFQIEKSVIQDFEKQVAKEFKLEYEY